MGMCCGGSWGTMAAPPTAAQEEEEEEMTPDVEVTRGSRGRMDGGGRTPPPPPPLGVVGEGVLLRRSRLLFAPMWLEWLAPG